MKEIQYFHLKGWENIGKWLTETKLFENEKLELIFIVHIILRSKYCLNQLDN